LRVSYLDSIRGIGAVQVLLLHVSSAFIPALVFPSSAGFIGNVIHFSPALMLYDGYAAVYVFFALSGLVLTLAFAQPDVPGYAQVPARLIRLTLPAVVACLFSLAIIVVFHPETALAGRMVGSNWLASLLRPPVGIAYFLKDAFVNSILLGYAQLGTPSFLGFGAGLNTTAQAYVAPLWTLSIEMQGSVLIVVMTRLLLTSRRWWLVAAVAVSIFFIRSHFFCFLVGHFLAVSMQRRGKEIDLHWPVSLLCATIAIWLCISDELLPGQLDAICTDSLFFLFPCTNHLQATIAALFLFVAICGSPAARAVLSGRLLRELGRISFPLYLVHWPIVLGIGSVVFLLAEPHMPLSWARAVTIGAVVPLSLAAAAAFVVIDRLSTRLSRLARDRLAVAHQRTGVGGHPDEAGQG
jgi:peptidoglycan/LPS O-acetylase OafA/YrhL